MNAGFSDGRSGFRVSPSPERFEPNCGVNGKPLSSVAIPFNCQPPISFPSRRIAEQAALSERQFITRRDAGLVVDVQRRGSPVAAQIVAVQNHLRLIIGLRAGQRGIHIQILRPGVVGAELQAVAQAGASHRSAARCSCCCLRCTRRNPRPDTDWAASPHRDVLRALRHGAFGGARCAARQRNRSRSRRSAAGMLFGSMLSRP